MIIFSDRTPDDFLGCEISKISYVIKLDSLQVRSHC